LTITGRKMTSRATVAWCNKNFVRKDWTRNQAIQGTPKRIKNGERLWKFLECNNGIRDRSLKQKLHSRKRIKYLGGRLPLCPRNEKTFSWTYRKTINSMKIAKGKAGSYAALRKIKDWTLWRGRPPPKQKKKRWVEREQVR
jgi:hypothetical protein